MENRNLKPFDRILARTLATELSGEALKAIRGGGAEQEVDSCPNCSTLLSSDADDHEDK